MRSSELARSAGVSVRTLRHYHQIGLLAEPVRGGNGYRHYDVHDLIRVLRIRRLAGLGIALEQMPDLLERPDESADDALDVLDQELAQQIEGLTRQRALIAELRTHRSFPDLPPELGRLLMLVSGSTATRHVEREQLVLLAHLVGAEGLPQLTRYYERVTSPELRSVMVDLVRRFDRLGPGSGDEVENLVAELAVALAPVVRETATEPLLADLRDSTALLQEHTDTSLNEEQQQVLRALGEQLDQLLSAP